MKPTLVRQLERFHSKRADGRRHTCYRDLYKCPQCGNHYEALRAVVKQGYKKTCGQCPEPVAPVRAKRSLHLLYTDNNRTVVQAQQLSTLSILPVGAV